MSIKPLRTHYAFETPASIFDEEALTALELAGRQGAKINEIVEVVNELDTHTRETLKGQDEKVEQYTKEMAEALDKFTAETDDKIDTFLTDTAPGIVEAEVQRAIKDGEFDESLEKTIEGAMTERENPETLDADLCTENGMFYVRTADGEWKNVPDTQGGVLLCVYGGTDTRFYQIFIDYNESKMYVRSKRSDGFTDWYKVANDKLTVSQKWFDTSATVDFDTLTESGYYMLSSNNAYVNGPDGVNAGVLVVYKDSRGTQVYQMVIAYGTNQVYARGGYQGAFDEWKTSESACTCDPEAGGTGTGGSTDTGGSTGDTIIIQGESYPGNFYLERGEYNDFIGAYAMKIYKPTPKGFICYHLAPAVDEEEWTYAVYRIMHIWACDKDKNVVHEISPEGCDCEGAYIITGQSDYVCGVHGGEMILEDGWSDLYIDGVSTAMENIPETQWCNSIMVDVFTECMQKPAGTMVMFNRVKRMIFANGKLTIMNAFSPTTEMTNKSVTFKMGMMNAPDSVFYSTLFGVVSGAITNSIVTKNYKADELGREVLVTGQCTEILRYVGATRTLYTQFERLNNRSKAYMVTDEISISSPSSVTDIFTVEMEHNY